MKKHKKHILTKQEVLDITSNDIDVCRRYISELDSIGGDEKKSSRIKKNIGRIICKLRWRYGITISWLQVNSAEKAQDWLKVKDIMDVERGLCDDIAVIKHTFITLEELINHTTTPNTLTRDKIAKRKVYRPRDVSPTIYVYKQGRHQGETTRKEWRTVIVRRG
jgi:RNase P subunit RPR2